MIASARLGGFKILKDVVWISLIQHEKDDHTPASLCHALAEQKINLPFITCNKNDRSWGVNFVVLSSDAQKAANCLQENTMDPCNPPTSGAILSIFPHKSNPEVMASLLDVFAGQEVTPDALANSNSAISVVLREEQVNGVAKALFQTFRFSAYRTPEDWKLAQKGKEKLYKEVVASYQEKRPKVYGLEWQDGLQRLQIMLRRENLGSLGETFRRLSQLGIVLNFLITSPSGGKNETILSFSLSQCQKRAYQHLIEALPSGTILNGLSPVAHFSMNGPHFGDRYGIASELFSALARAQVNLLGLSCSIASITGLVPADQIFTSIQAIQNCFDVPSVTKRTDQGIV